MCKELDEELQRGQDAAIALVEHLEHMGGACKLEMPLSHVDHHGRLHEWKITVELVSQLEV